MHARKPWEDWVLFGPESRPCYGPKDWAKKRHPRPHREEIPRWRALGRCRIPGEEEGEMTAARTQRMPKHLVRQLIADQERVLAQMPAESREAPLRSIWRTYRLTALRDYLCSGVDLRDAETLAGNEARLLQQQGDQAGDGKVFAFVAALTDALHCAANGH